MDWSVWLNEQEVVTWQGRPAPRCFVFRQWQRALFGGLILLVALWWQWVGIGLESEHQQWWWAVLPVPFVLIGLWLSVGRLLAARYEWRQVFYALTDQRLLVQCGLGRARLIALPCAQLTYARVTLVGEHLGHLYVEAGTRKLTLSCVEYPEKLYALMEVRISANQTAVPPA
nr:hypothetical protein [uncultured Desulfuromonas sp.]